MVLEPRNKASIGSRIYLRSEFDTQNKKLRIENLGNCPKPFKMILRA
jgi:hypothetical protein